MSSDAQHENPRPDPSQMSEAEYADYMADPHSFHPDHHGAGEHGHDGEGHHVVSLFLLRVVLGTLVFFTLLTVAASRGEIWLASTFELEIPTIVNVLVAMSIATIKALFVVGIFMHLKWDNRLNMLVLLFTLLGVGLFIGLTAMDLGNRQELYDWKGGQIQAGGLGGLKRGEDTTISTGMVEFARTTKINEVGEAEYARLVAENHPHHDHAEPLRSPDRSRATHGLTAGLYSAEAPHDAHAHGASHDEGDGESHDDGHGAGAPPEHAEPAEGH